MDPFSQVFEGSCGHRVSEMDSWENYHPSHVTVLYLSVPSQFFTVLGFSWQWSFHIKTRTFQPIPVPFRSTWNPNTPLGCIQKMVFHRSMLALRVQSTIKRV